MSLRTSRTSLPSKPTEGVAPYPVVDHFYTVQGEGYWTGTAAYFIRLGGCDVGCPWCDTKESWPVEDHPYLRPQIIADHVRKASGEIVVITGGEPTMHDLNPLTRAIKDTCQKRIHIETSGAHPLTGRLDWVTLSPKKFKPPLDENVDRADELKIVVSNQTEFRWAEEYAAKCPEETILILQPEWNVRAEMTPHIVRYIKNHPKWRISLQSHKYMEIP